jgi:transposase InsO family protein
MVKISGILNTSDTFSKRCTDMGITQSMGTVGDSYDNAMTESLWSSLKREAIDFKHLTTIDEARRVVFEWLVWYNKDFIAPLDMYLR